MNSGVYLYGIFPEVIPTEITLKGLDSQPVYSHILDGFTFLYSEAKQEKYLASRRNLLNHEKVLEEVMHTGYTAVLPLRFGLVVKNWDTVITQLIQPYKEQLKELFTKLTGRREVSVKIFWDPKSELQAMMESNLDLKQKRDQMEGKALSMEEVINIGQLIENNLKSRKESVIQAFFNELRPLADEVIESDTMTEDMIYNAAFLIPWDKESIFSERIEAIDQKFGERLRIRYNNFTAPYTFAQIYS